MVSPVNELAFASYWSIVLKRKALSQLGQSGGACDQNTARLEFELRLGSFDMHCSVIY